MQSFSHDDLQKDHLPHDLKQFWEGYLSVQKAGFRPYPVTFRGLEFSVLPEDYGVATTSKTTG